MPIVLEKPKHPVSEVYMRIAAQLVATIPG
jgi:hypothetical protein